MYNAIILNVNRKVPTEPEVNGEPVRREDDSVCHRGYSG